MATVLIAGGTGFIGSILIKQLVAKHYNVIVLTRSLNNKKESTQISYAKWDVQKGEIDVAAMQKADAIIQLTGAGVVDKKWTEAYKKEIETSRTKSCQLIVDTLKNNTQQVKTIVCASAIGWYGQDEVLGKAFVETDPADEGFLGQVCKKWEESIEPAIELGIRVCKLRTGIVLGHKAGAYPEFAKPTKFGIAAILGTGKQIVSWIHIDDLCRQYIYALENNNMQGSYNAVAPVPVTNAVLTKTIAQTVRGKFYLPIHVPVFVLKLMLGQRSIEILKSTTVSAVKIKSEGFTFIYPTVEAAVKELETSK